MESGSSNNIRGSRELESLKEIEGLFKNRLDNCNVQYSQDKYAHYDLYVDNKAFIEVKERINRYSQLDNFIKYGEEGWQLETTKYNFLYGKINRYMNLFRIEGEIVVLAWDVNKIANESVFLNCPATTDFDRSNFYLKPSILLPSSTATVFIKKDDTTWDNITYEALIIKLIANSKKEL